MAEQGKSNFQVMAEVARKLEDLEVESMSAEKDADYQKEIQEWLATVGKSIQTQRGGHIHANYIHRQANGKKIVLRLSLDVLEV